VRPFTTDQLESGISNALGFGDLVAARQLLLALATADPDRAEVVLQAVGLAAALESCDPPAATGADPAGQP